MAKQVIKYQDNNGRLHDTEAEANRADQRRAAERVLAPACMGAGAADLTQIDAYNADALRPLHDYIGMLMRESNERTKKFG